MLPLIVFELRGVQINNNNNNNLTIFFYSVKSTSVLLRAMEK